MKISTASPKVLVTGDRGFVGRHFCSQYAGLRFEDAGGVVDLRDPVRVLSAIALLEPEAVLHLAAQSSVASSLKNPLETYSVNFLGTFNLLEALGAIGFKGVFVYVSSADVYGAVEESRLPIREDLAALPRSPYAVSKVAAEALCYQWSLTAGFRVVVVRPFNQIGPGHDNRFAIPSFAHQILAIRRGEQACKIVTGDLTITRDFTDVRDAVRAMHMALEKGKNGETYNICSGHERTVKSLVEELISLAGVEATLEVDPSRMRPAEQRRMVGDPSKIREQLGWTTHIPLRTTLEDILKDTENKTHV
jgi:GDP-4-dehydro-6-deoxy-D-mannose reductase